MTEKELVAMILRGNVEAFEPLVAPYRRPLLSLALRMVPDMEDAREAASGTPIPSSSTSVVQTTLTMKSGEKTVVGVSKMDGGDKGLILIISGKVIN